MHNQILNKFVSIWRLQLILCLAISLSSDLMSQDEEDDSPEFEGRIAGVVLDDDQKPIQNALVVAEGHVKNKFTARASTDKNGMFEIVLPPEFADADVANIWLWAHAPGKNVKCVFPFANPQGYCNCMIQLDEESTIRIAIEGSDEQPCMGVSCQGFYYEYPKGVYESDTTTGLRALVPELIARELSTESDEEGSVVIKGYSEILLSSVLLSREGILPQDHNISRNIRLAPTGTVVGSVIGFDNLPVEGNKVYLSTGLSGAVRLRHSYTLDKKGEFKVEGFAVGEIAVSLEWPSRLPKQPYLIGPQKLTEGATIEFTIELVDAVKIEGRVIAQDTREGIPFAKVSIREQIAPTGQEMILLGNNYKAETDEEGAYSAYVVPGSYSIHVYDLRAWKQKGNYKSPKSIAFQCRAAEGEKKLEDSEAIPVKRVTGKVEGVDGNPTPNRWVVFISPMFGDIDKYGKTNDQGVFSFIESRRNNDPNFKWVLFPEGAKIRSFDGRKLPALRIRNDYPLELVEEKVEQENPMR